MKLARWAALILAYVFLGLALIGVLLPGLPTVPFLLLSAWFSAKGSRRLHRWLYSHPHFGKLLIDWEQQGAVSRSSKVLATVFMAASWVIMYSRVDNVWLPIGLALLFVCVLAFLWSRPEPRPKIPERRDAGDLKEQKQNTQNESTQNESAQNESAQK